MGSHSVTVLPGTRHKWTRPA